MTALEVLHLLAFQWHLPCSQSALRMHRETRAATPRQHLGLARSLTQ